MRVGEIEREEKGQGKRERVGGRDKGRQTLSMEQEKECA